MKTFGDILESLMVAKNIKYATELAQYVGLSADTINKYRKKPTAEMIEVTALKRIADYFNVSVDYLLSYDIEEVEIKSLDNYKYLNKENTGRIILDDFIFEMEDALMKSVVVIDGIDIGDKKKYIIDSFSTAMKYGKELLKWNV